MQQYVVAEECRDARLRRHVQVAQRCANAPFIITQLVDKLFPRIFRMDIQPDA